MQIKGQDAKTFIENMNSAVMTPERLQYLQCAAEASRQAEKRSIEDMAEQKLPEGFILCDKVAEVIIVGGMWKVCALEAGHEGECLGNGECVRHGYYVGSRCPHWPTCAKTVVMHGPHGSTVKISQSDVAELERKEGK